MHLKRFKGKEMHDVMRQVREELGPTALILHTKPTRPRGLLRFLRGTRVELVAAVDVPETPVQGSGLRPSPADVPRGSAPPSRTPASDELRAALGELKALVLRQGGARLLPPALAASWERLVGAGVEESLVFRVLDALARDGEGRLSDPTALGGALEDAIATLVRVGGCPLPPRPGVLALVGPAGAGKTTALAKLASHAHLAGIKTEILSLDGANLGATGYLDTLSRILGVPYVLAPTREALARELERERARGLVLVDTPGVSARDGRGLQALGELLRACRATEVHLVVSATSKAADALAAVRAFAPLPTTHLLFSRLDETTSCGSLLGVSVEGGLPLSYFGTGREVPNDIQPAAARELARRVLRGDHDR